MPKIFCFKLKCIIFAFLLIANTLYAFVPNYAVNDDGVLGGIGYIHDVKFFDNGNKIYLTTSLGFYELGMNDRVVTRISQLQNMGYFKTFPKSPRILYFDLKEKNYKLFDYAAGEIILVINHPIKWWDHDARGKTKHPNPLSITHENSLALSADEKYLLFFTMDNSIIVYDLETKEIVQKRDFDYEILSLGFHDNNTIWVGSKNQSLSFYNFHDFLHARNLSSIKSIQLIHDPIHVYSDKNIVLAIGTQAKISYSHSYHIYNTNNGELIKGLGGDFYNFMGDLYKPLRFNPSTTDNSIFYILHQVYSYTPACYNLKNNEITESFSLWDPMPFATTIFCNSFYNRCDFFYKHWGNLFTLNFNEDFTGYDITTIYPKPEPYKYVFFAPTNAGHVQVVSDHRQYLEISLTTRENQIVFHGASEYVLEPPIVYSNNGEQLFSVGNGRIFTVKGKSLHLWLDIIWDVKAYTGFFSPDDLSVF
ncbi:hypothetical protein GF373_10625, partial [bacterium]|nr:hypothetical protein [bacterium]